MNKELWIIDPDQKDVTVYRFDQDSTHPVSNLSGQGGVSSTHVFPVFPECDS